MEVVHVPGDQDEEVLLQEDEVKPLAGIFPLGNISKVKRMHHLQ